LTTVDHRELGSVHGFLAMFSLLWAGVAVSLMPFEFVTPAPALLTRQPYNGLLTTYGITMLFLFGTPMLAAFPNYVVPPLIGADDMAFPCINAIAFWLFVPAAMLVLGWYFPGLVENIGPSMTSWTMYPPQADGRTAGGGVATSVGDLNAGTGLMLLGLHLAGISTTMGVINFITTIFVARASFEHLAITAASNRRFRRVGETLTAIRRIEGRATRTI
jgi:cytochrome c oxidase subunit 1